MHSTRILMSKHTHNLVKCLKTMKILAVAYGQRITINPTGVARKNFVWALFVYSLQPLKFSTPLTIDLIASFQWLVFELPVLLADLFEVPKRSQNRTSVFFRFSCGNHKLRSFQHLTCHL